MVGIKDLYRQRYPSAGGTAVGKAGPALSDTAELLFDRRNKFGLDGVAVGPKIRRVHGVGIVIVRVGGINFRDQYAGKAGRNPLLIELVSFVLLNAVVAGYVEALTVVGL